MGLLQRLFPPPPAPVDPAPQDYEAKLRRAAQLYGRPFKCAADGLPREVIRNGQTTVTPSATVTPIKKGKR